MLKNNFDQMDDHLKMDGFFEAGRAEVRRVAKRVVDSLAVPALTFGIPTTLLALYAWFGGGVGEAKAAGLRELNVGGANGARWSEQTGGDHTLIMGGDGDGDGKNPKLRKGQGIEDGLAVAEVKAVGVKDNLGMKQIDELQILPSGATGADESLIRSAMGVGSAGNSAVADILQFKYVEKGRIDGRDSKANFGGRGADGIYTRVGPDVVMTTDEVKTSRSIFLVSRVDGSLGWVAGVDNEGSIVGIGDGSDVLKQFAAERRESTLGIVDDSGNYFPLIERGQDQDGYAVAVGSGEQRIKVVDGGAKDATISSKALDGFEFHAPAGGGVEAVVVQAEFDLTTVKGMEQIGDSWKFVDSAGKEYVFSEKTLAGQKPNDNGILMVGAYNIDVNTGVVTPISSAFPRSVTETERFRSFVIDMASENWMAQYRTAIDAMHAGLVGGDLGKVFEGINIVDKEKGKLQNVDVRPEYWDLKNADIGRGLIPGLALNNSADNRLSARNPEANPIKVYPDGGYMKLKFEVPASEDGSMAAGVVDVVLVPVVMMEKDRSITVSQGLMYPEALVGAADGLDCTGSYCLNPRVIAGLRKPNPAFKWESEWRTSLWSDPNLRRLMAKINQDFMDKYGGEKKLLMLPDEIRYVVFDMFKIYPQSD